MKINILEDITSTLAARVLTDIGESGDKEIEVNIMSYGGEMNAGNAIISALKLHPARVTTKVYGVAASMAAAISQAGDERLIAEDAIFQPHNGAGMNGGRPTKENLRSVADQLDVMDAIMLKSFSKSNLTESALKDLLIKDTPMTAQEAMSMEFFDGSIEPIKAAAYIKHINMSNETGLMAKLEAIKQKFMPTAEEVVDETPVLETEDVAEEVIEESVSRAEFDKLVSLVEELITKMSPLDAPSVTETVAAKVEEMFKAIKSTSTMPTASTADLVVEEVVEAEVGFLEARQKEIESKFKK